MRNSTYDKDIKDKDAKIIEAMDIADFYKHGWPNKPVWIYTSPTWDIPGTVNEALEVMNKNGVIHAVVVIPTGYEIVKRNKKEE